MQAATPPGAQRADTSLFIGQDWLTEIGRQFHKLGKKTIADVDWSAVVKIINQSDPKSSTEAEPSDGDVEVPARSSTPPPADGSVSLFNQENYVNDL